MSRRVLPSWMTKSDSTQKKQNDKAATEEKHPVSNVATSYPFLDFPGEIIYCYNSNECNSHCEDIICTAKAVGFDIEWKIAYVKGVYNKTATIQLCTGEHKCYIFQLAHMNFIPIKLKHLLSSEDIKKVGVGIQGDVSRLYVDYTLFVGGVVDLGVMGNDKLRTNENWSLNNLLLNQAHKQLKKKKSIRCSNWEKIPLDEEQLHYAALDAYAGWYLFQILSKKTTK